MSKTNDNSNLVTHDTLADVELDTVSGGMLSFGDGRAATAPQSNTALSQILQQLIQQLSSQGTRGATTTGT